MMKLRKIYILYYLLFGSGFCLKAQIWLSGYEGNVIGNSYFEGMSISTGNGDAAYLAGYFQGDVKVNNNTFNTTSINVLLIKVNSESKALWARQSSGASFASSAYAYGTSTDKNGNIYVIGCFYDTVTFSPFTMITPYYGSIFLVKYDSGGNVIWARQSNPIPFGQGQGLSVTTDKLDNIYITGYFSGQIQLGTFTLSTGSSGYPCAFIAKYDSNGNVIWAKQSTSSNNKPYSLGFSIATDAIGNVFIAGSFQDTIIFGNDTLYSPGYGGERVFIVKYDFNGNSLWARQSYHSGVFDHSRAYSIATDRSNNVYITGSFNNYVIFGNDTLNKASPYDDIFLCKYSPKGVLKWAKEAQVLDSNDWFGDGIAVDSLYNLYCIGNGTSIDGSPASYLMRYANDTFSTKIDTTDGASIIMKCDSSGQILCGSILAGGGDDNNAITTNVTGEFVYIGGDLYNTLILGKDTLPIENQEAPFVARWVGCSYINNISPACNHTCNDSATVIPNGGIPPYTYRWNTVPVQTAQTAVGLCADSTYSVLVSDAGGHNELEEVTISQFPVPLRISATKKQICKGDTTTLDADGILSYTWNPSVDLSCNNCPSTIASPILTTMYTVSGKDSLGCFDRDSITIFVDTMDAYVCCDTTIFKGQTVILSATWADSYLWQPNIGIDCSNCQNVIANPDSTITYTITITDSNGCKAVKTVTVTIKPKPTENCGELFVPDAFSPNGDGQNDIFYVRDNCVATFHLIIYDRWGEKVFESENINEGWDGKYHGQSENAGTYLYYLQGTYTNGNSFSKKGNLALVR